MDTATRELLNGIAVYAELLNNINMKFHMLIEQNINNQFHENEQLFYEIISEIMRVLPIKKSIDGKEIVGPDIKSGILLFQAGIPFLLEDYQRIVNNDVYKKILLDMSTVRNKFMHEPHNIRASFYVGGKTSCSMLLYYKDQLCSVSTIKMTNIIYELNAIFDKLKTFFLDKADSYGEQYREYPCYQAMLSYDFKKYNIDYPMLPEWLIMDPEEEIEIVF